MPVRLAKGRRVLLLMAAIVVGVTVWEILNHNLDNGWNALPLQLFRVVVPLVLIWSIWRGRSWARYVLAVFCGYTIYVNVPQAMHLPEMVSRGNMGDVILVLSMLIGYTIIGGLAFFSPTLSAHMNYRNGEGELI